MNNFYAKNSIVMRKNKRVIYGEINRNDFFL